MSESLKLHKWTTEESKNIELGQAGYEILTVTGGSAVSSSVSNSTGLPEVVYYAFTALTDNCRITGYDWEPSSAAVGSTGVDSEYANRPIPIGTTVYGNWKSVVMISGDSGDDTGILYKGSIHRHPEKISEQN